MKYVWTLCPVSKMWGTQAEEVYADGRYFLVPRGEEFELWGYDKNEPLIRGTMEDCKAFAETLPSEPPETK